MKLRNWLIAGILILILSAAAQLPVRSTLSSLVYDMFNQVSIKPQEKGSMEAFAVGAVSTDGSEIEYPNDRFGRIIKDVIPAPTAIHPTGSRSASLAEGKLMYNTICRVCHGTGREINAVGFAKSNVNDLGMIAPAVVTLAPFLSDSHIYYMIKYGGQIMPPLGYAVTSGERRNIIKHIRELEKRK